MSLNNLEGKTLERIEPDATMIQIADYVGDPVPAKTVDECLTQAEGLFQEVSRWLKANRSDLLPSK